ncbi:MAG TPA: hypothetical protein VNI83_01680 [Vicinamibacterales bacterium]|nr:hypothetical protein [Vicinamibacterales bacterium]
MKARRARGHGRRPARPRVELLNVYLVDLIGEAEGLVRTLAKMRSLADRLGAAHSAAESGEARPSVLALLGEELGQVASRLDGLRTLAAEVERVLSELAGETPSQA